MHYSPPLLWKTLNRPAYYAALLPRRGPHIASHSVCLSVCLSVRPVIVIERHVAPPSELQWHMYFSAEGRISYSHLGRTNSCFVHRQRPVRFSFVTVLWSHSCKSQSGKFCSKVFFSRWHVLYNVMVTVFFIFLYCHHPQSSPSLQGC